MEGAPDISTAAATPEPKLIDFNLLLKKPWQRAAFSRIGGALERFLGIDTLNKAYDRTIHRSEGRNFFEKALREINVQYLISEEDRARIPTSGPLVVVANHPLGALEGIVLGALLLSVRQDVKLLVNYLLNHMQAMRPWNIAVDPFGGLDATRSNIGPIKECLKWLKGGGVIATFPSGTVSHYHISKGTVTDPVWNANIAALARHSKATVLPVYFPGRNGLLFQIAGFLHPRLRTILLPREFSKRLGTDLHVRVGRPIPPSKLKEFVDDKEAIDYLRLKTYILKDREDGNSNKPPLRLPEPPKGAVPTHHEPLIPPVSKELLAAEIAALSPHMLVATHNEYKVYVATAEEIPHCLREIGRLREQTFREVGEGTGKPLDLDDFDDYYLHLFMWNNQAKDIVGAYRLGCTDTILQKYGKKGLYTSTLFRYRFGLLERLNPAIELGRSFIQSAYQKKHVGLSLLWRGIAEFIVRNPRYKLLFGPVSISNEYLPLSKNLMVQFLKRNSMHRKYRWFVRAKRPPRALSLSGLDRKALKDVVKDIEDVSALISEIETDHKGVPVLLRQYLKLNATMLSFNVDEDFANCIDGLVLVDLLSTDPKTLKRFMGEGIEQFYAFHRQTDKATDIDTESTLSA